VIEYMSRETAQRAIDVHSGPSVTLRRTQIGVCNLQGCDLDHAMQASRRVLHSNISLPRASAGEMWRNWQHRIGTFRIPCGHGGGPSRPCEPVDNCCLSKHMLLLLALLTLAAGPAGVAPQGLRLEDDAPARSSGAFARFSDYYKKSVAWRNAMRLSPRSACSQQSGSLCSGSLNAGQQAALQLASAPQAWDSREALGRSGAQVVGPVKDQGDCGTW
jgi:hypothetical protein